MGSVGCTNQAMKCQNLPTKAPEKSNTNGIVESRKELHDETVSLEPITPDSDRENGDFSADHHSPLSSVKKTENVARYDSDEDSKDCVSPHTPKEGVFDPFAPGPEDKALAPICRKYASKPRSIIVRRLSFDASVEVYDDAASVSDEEIVEAVYEVLLETIVSSQTEVVLAEMSGREWDPSECRTPTSAPRLSGIAKTCPGAPLRPGGESRRVNSALCRKLQFSP